MDGKQMREAWERVRQECGTNGWTVSDASTYYGFFVHGYLAGHAAGMERAAAIAQNRAIYADTEGADELNAVAKDIRAEIPKGKP